MRRARRRSRQEIRLGRFVTIGQHWRRRQDGSVWRVQQVHRADGEVVLALACPPTVPYPPGSRLADTFAMPLDRLSRGRGWAWLADPSSVFRPPAVQPSAQRPFGDLQAPASTPRLQGGHSPAAGDGSVPPECAGTRGTSLNSQPGRPHA